MRCFYKMNKVISLVKYILVIALVLVIDAVICEPYGLKITSYNLRNSQLSGLKIVFATDLHIAPYKWENWRLQRIVKAINKQSPDLVVLGGDYVNGHDYDGTMQPEDIAESLQQIKAPKVAVMGNHDSYYGKYDVTKAFEEAKIPVLDNRNIKLNLNGRKIYIAGVSDYDTDKPDIEKALKNTKSPLIFVTHSPDVFVNLGGRADIAFAGHTHGGQVVLPFWGAVMINTATGRKYTYGQIFEDDKPLIVSSGLGTSVLPIRFNNRPEIVTVNFE